MLQSRWCESDLRIEQRLSLGLLQILHNTNRRISSRNQENEGGGRQACRFHGLEVCKSTITERALLCIMLSETRCHGKTQLLIVANSTVGISVVVGVASIVVVDGRALFSFLYSGDGVLGEVMETNVFVGAKWGCCAPQHHTTID